MKQFIAAVLIFVASASAESRILQDFQRKAAKGKGKLSSPLSSVSYPAAVALGDEITILADGTDKYGQPVVVEFFLNGQSIARQSTPPFGITVTQEDYQTLPVNFTVIVTDDYGNASRADIAVTSQDLAETLDCSYTSTDSTDPVEITATSVTTTQSGNNVVTFTLSGTDSNGDAQDISVAASLNVVAGTADGTLLITKGGITTAVAVTGTSTLASDGLTLSTLTVESSEATHSISCS